MQTSDERLLVNGYEHRAVFFHLPEEPYGFLSNWFSASFTADDVTFSSCEQYIMYQKCMLFLDDASAAAVLATDDPAQQQKIGRKAANFCPVVWDGMKQLIAYQGLVAKFSQNPQLAERLLATEDAFLVECAHFDKVWTCGARLNEPERHNIAKWTGQNILGFTLMKVRDTIRSTI